MAGVRVKWTGGQQYLAVDEAGHFVVTDSQGQGFKPAELVLVALAGCAGVDLVGILEKKRQKFTGIEVKVTKQNAPEPPWAFEKIEIEWTVRGRDLKQKAVHDAVHLAEEKYCSVAASLKCEIITTVHVIDEEERTG